MKWSNKWKSSKQPGKQRKYRYTAPLHILRKFLGVNLNEKLRTQYNKRSIPVKKGDEVIVKRGKSKGIIGEVTGVDTKKTKVYVKGIVRKKVNGTEIQIPLHPSNLQILRLNLDDPKRIDSLKRK